AEELHEAAERNGADLPARAVAIVPAEQLAAEADGEYLDPHAAAARHPVVSQFVDEYDDRKNDDERDDVSGEIGNEIHRHLGHRLSGPSPSSRLYPYDIPAACWIDQVRRIAPRLAIRGTNRLEIRKRARFKMRQGLLDNTRDVEE